MKKFVSPYGATGRRNFVLLLLSVFSVAIVLRVLFLQECSVHFWAEIDEKTQKRKCAANFIKAKAEARFFRQYEVPAMRGSITDRNGVPLAVSTPVRSIWVNPMEITEHQGAIAALAMMTAIPLNKLQKKIEQRKASAYPTFMYIERGLEPALAKQITDKKIPGVYSLQEYRRFYPSADVTSQVVGFNDTDDKGVGGIERIYNQWLSGTVGSSKIVRDPSGRVVDILEEITPPVQGQGLALTIDKRIQYLTYVNLLEAAEKFAAQSATAVVLDAKTAEVLAMVSVPSGNPNNAQEKKPALIRNRAVTDVFEPGSVIKPMVIAAAMEAGLVNRYTPIDTRPGRFKVGRNWIKDTQNFGQLDVTGVIKKSSNIGICKVALRLPKENLQAMYSALGFGQKTAIDFRGERKGRLNNIAQLGDFEYCTNAYGYGLSATVLQVAQAYAVLANDGVKVPVSLVKRQSQPGGQRLMSKRSATEVRQMLAAAVDIEGTGSRASMGDYMQDYSVGGKTGTVHKIIDGAYDKDRYQSIFAGIAPLSDPKIVMVVMLDDPRGDAYYGGLVAAPVFAKVVGKTLRIMGVSPDKSPDKPQTVVQVADRPGVQKP